MDPPAKNYTLCGLKVQKDPATGEIKILAGTVKETPSCNTSPSVAPAGAGAGASVSAGVATPPTTGTTLETDARFAKYVKQKGVGLIQPAVTRIAGVDGIHESYINLIFTAPNTPAPPEGTDLSLPYTPVSSSSSSSTASSSTAPIKQDYIDNIHPYDTKTKLDEADIKKIIPSLNELKQQRDNNPRASNITEVKQIIQKVDALIKTTVHDIIQPLIDTLIAIPDGGPLKGKAQTDADDAIKKLGEKIGLYPYADNKTSANEEIKRVKKMLPDKGSLATAAAAARQNMKLNAAIKASKAYTEEKINSDSDITAAATAANALRIAIRENPLASNKPDAENELIRINGFINAAPGGPAAAATALTAAPRRGGRRTRNYRKNNHRRRNTRRSKH